MYAINDVVLIPLSSQTEASNAITQANAALKKKSGNVTEESDSDVTEGEEDEDDRQTNETGSVRTVDTQPEDGPLEQRRRDSSVARDVLSKKGQYGRFAERWFSKKGWVAERRMAQGMSSDEAPIPSGRTSNAGEIRTTNEIREGGDADRSEGELQLEKPSAQNAAINFPLLSKLLRTARMILSSQNFFFSYDVDISRRLGNQDHRSNPDFPLYTSFEDMVNLGH